MAGKSPMLDHGVLPHRRRGQPAPLADAAPKTIKLLLSNVRLELRPETYGNRTTTRILELPSDTNLYALRDVLLNDLERSKKASRYRYTGFEDLGFIDTQWKDVLTTEVQVTDGPSVYDPAYGLKVNSNEMIASFLSKCFPAPLQARLHDDGRTNKANETKSPFDKVCSDSIAIGDVGAPDLVISFQRTVRIPETGKEYHLPPGLGRFPIFDIRRFAARLPPSMAAKGGLFFPMYQMEAMWINFECRSDMRFAIRPLFGDINGITGKSCLGSTDASSQKAGRQGCEQDYVVLPEQPWLDGIASSPGVVQQFVATQMARPRKRTASTSHPKRDLEPFKRGVNGTKAQPGHGGGNDGPGASIEQQKTGYDHVGGFQLQIIPQHATQRMHAGSVRNVCRDWVTGWTHSPFHDDHLPSNFRVYDVLKSPHELELNVGDIIHAKHNRKEINHLRGKNLGDLVLEHPSGPLHAPATIELTAFYNTGPTRAIKVAPLGRPQICREFTFDWDDEFNDALKVICAKLGPTQSTGAMLAASVKASNTDGHGLIPVESWEDLAAMENMEDAGKVLVLVSEQQKNECQYVCRIKWTNDTPLLDARPVLLALGHTSTMADIRSELQRLFEIDLTLYSIKSPSLERNGEDNRVFEGHGRAAGYMASNRWMASLLYPTLTMVHTPVRICLETLDKRIMHISCGIDTTVRSLLMLVLEQDETALIGHDHSYLHPLSFMGQQLPPRAFLSSFNIVNRSLLHVQPRELPFEVVAGSLDVYVKTLTGKTIHLQVKSDDTINTLKGMIYELEGIPKNQQDLISAGKHLKDDRTLSEYSVGHKATIHLILRLRGGGPGAVHVLYDDREEVISLHDSTMTIGQVKLECYKRLGIPIREQTLVHDGKVIDNNTKATNYWNKTLELQASGPVTPQALAFGAGGRIRQRIEPDPTENPRIWNVADSKILNIQLLDARSFQEVTGLPPPKTPVTAETYKKMGLPFFQLVDKNGKNICETGGAGIAGDWGGMVGVAEAAAKQVSAGEDEDEMVVEDVEDGEWGLLKTGAWALPEQDADGNTVPAGERDFDNPLVLLDVDDKIRPFKGVTTERQVARKGARKGK